MLERISSLDTKKIIAGLIIIHSLLFIPFLGTVRLFDWDEINFAECAREMIETGDYLRVYIDYEPFWEKPPLFFWFQVVSMKIFGVTEFAARLPNALTGIISAVMLFVIGSRFKDNKFGLLWVLAYTGSVLPYFYFRSGIIDPVFNLFMFLSVIYAFSAFKREELKPLKYAVVSGIFSGLAVLVKGPVGLLLPGLSIFIFALLFRRDDIKKFAFVIVTYTLLAILTAFIWFGIEIAKNGTWFVSEFITYQIRLLTTGDAGFSGPVYYHFIVILLGCFPASVLIFSAFKYKQELPEKKEFTFLMLILLSVVLIIFSIVKTKIVHYSSLAYYPVTFLAAYTVYNILAGKIKISKLGISFNLIVGTIVGILVTGIALAGIYKDALMPYLTDDFVKGNLQADVYWSGFEPLIGLSFIVAVITGSIFLFRKNFEKGFLTLFISTALMLTLLLPLVVHRVEGYTQGTPIEFYESLKGKDVYVKAIGFRSYADLFYSGKPKHLSASGIGVKHSNIEDHLMNGEIDKPAYFVTKINEYHNWENHPNLELIEIKNGFVFLKRKDSTIKK
ncbi:MAG: glycosyltransferase family 39 protein [Ignavibacteriaceae bacterium]|nr:glycosyltransferase family 39 protein [Ignavibacteriaceae bacterium]